MGKHRVYEIAKELGKTNQEVIDILAKNNIQVKSTLSTVDDTVRDLVVKNSARKPVQEKKAAPAPQHIVKKEPVKQAEAAPKQVQTQPNSAANTQRPQQQQGQRPNNQGQRPNNQGPRPAAVNHQQGQNAGQNRPNQGISQQNRPNNQQRDRMHDAQCLAGMAFSNALLGIVHSMAHKTGAAFADYGAHIIHGAANAMYLPKVIAFNAKDETAKKRYGVIADYMHLGGSNDDEKVKLLIEYVRGMNDKLNIPHCIKNYGTDSYPCEEGFVPENVFLERLPEIAKNAIADACTGSNPRQPSQEEMEKLLKCCYYDTEVDF